MTQKEKRKHSYINRTIDVRKRKDKSTEISKEKEKINFEEKNKGFRILTNDSMFGVKSRSQRRRFSSKQR